MWIRPPLPGNQGSLMTNPAIRLDDAARTSVPDLPHYQPRRQNCLALLSSLPVWTAGTGDAAKQPWLVAAG